MGFEVATERSFGSAGNKILKAALEKLNVPVVADEGYTTQTKDYTSYLLNIKKSKADVLVPYMREVGSCVYALKP